jgi:hypothetical protein
MQLGNRVRTEWGQRQRALVRARARFNAALPREGRVARQCRRCFLANNQVARLRQLREFCYPARQRRHWHQTNIYRALHKLGAQRIGWGVYAVR